LLAATLSTAIWINSPMLPQLKRDADGGFTVYIQSNPSGADKEANLLPARKGPFVCFLRLYWPKPEVKADGLRRP
jgi:hypothetical protein